MSSRIKFDIEPYITEPKIDTTNNIISYGELVQVQDLSVLERELKYPKNRETYENKDSWYNWTISLSLEGINPAVKEIENFFKALNNISNTIFQLLKVFRLFSGNVLSISGTLKFVIKQLNKEIKEFINSFTSTGVYMSLIIPDFDKRFPNYRIPTFGGYQEFIRRVNMTCLNSTDLDAPKFEEADKVGGVVIAMLGGIDDPDFLRNLVDNFRKLSTLFGFRVPYPASPVKFKAVPGFYEKDGIKKIGVKLTWETPISPVGSFFIYKTNNPLGTTKTYNVDGIDVEVKEFSTEPPVAKINYIPLKVLYSYIDFDVTPESVVFYKVYSVFGDDYLENNPYLKAINSPIATPTVTVSVPRECIPLSELSKYMNLSITGELLSPFDFEGEWQSVTVRRMLGGQIDNLFNNLDALTDKLLGLLETGSSSINTYLKFYKDRLVDILEIINRIKMISLRMSSLTQRGTFMVLNLPLEKGGMKGFVDRFNRACNTGTMDKSLPKEKKDLLDFLKNSVKVEKNTPIAMYNEKGIMFGLILLYGVPDFSDNRRFGNVLSKQKIKELERQFEQTGNAMSTFLKMLGLS